MRQENQTREASRLRPSAALRLTLRMSFLLTILVGGAAIHSASAQTCILDGMVKVIAEGQTGRLPEASLNLTPTNQEQGLRRAVMNEPGENKFANRTLQSFDHGSANPTVSDNTNESHASNLPAEIRALVERNVSSEASAQRASRDQSLRRRGARRDVRGKN